VYLLGAEDHGLSKMAKEKSHYLVKFQSILSLNVSVAGSIVMYDRQAKMKLS
jgi:tRNA (guanosine-2'-O-)-methyltransferase